MLVYEQFQSFLCLFANFDLYGGGDKMSLPSLCALQFIS